MLASTGVWFLKEGPGAYQILPRVRFSYRAIDLFLPMTELGDLGLWSGALDDLLLRLQVRWYESIESPTGLELSVLRSNPRFGLILGAIGMYPKDTSWIPLLQRLARLHTDGPGVDLAVAGALRKIGTKAVLPAMADLLDSKDPAAKLAAASFFGVFTLLADAQGEIRDSAPIGPYATEQTRAFTPKAGTSIAASDYARWWKIWWSANHDRLALPAE